MFEILKDKRIRFVLVLFLLIIILAVGIKAFLGRDHFRVIDLHIDRSNTSAVFDGSSLRAYDGLFFYKILSSSEEGTKLLGGGLKLPQITSIVWAGDNGALMNFDDSLIHTAVESVSNQKGLSYDDERNSTWYYDFKANTLRYVGTYTMYSNVHYFASNTLYYFTGDSGSYTLHAYDIRSGVDTPYTIPVNFDSISYVSTCPRAEGTVCVIAKRSSSIDREGVYAITGSKLVKELFSIKGDITPLPGTYKYLTLDSKDAISGSDEDSVVQYKKAVIFDAQTLKSIGEINQTLSPDGYMATTKDDDIVILDSQNGTYYTYFKPIWFTHVSKNTVRHTSGEVFTDAITSTTTPMPGGVVIKSTGANLELFASKSIDDSIFTPESSSAVMRSVNSCIGGDIVTRYITQTKTISILVPDDKMFDTNVSKISKCLSTKKNIVHGYNYSIVSYNPSNGQVTSY